MSKRTYQRRISDKPYKGSDSYQQEDSDLFFGRDREAKELKARILSSRFTLLHAPSGAGKTSLLNARLIPDLEQHGWIPVRALPQNSPSRALRVAALLNIIPSPRVEAVAVKQLLDHSKELGGRATIEDVLSFYDDNIHGLAIRDLRRRQWLAPIEGKLPVWSPRGPEMSWVNTHFSRLLRASIDINMFSQRIAALQSDMPEQSSLSISSSLPLSELYDLLNTPELHQAYVTLIGELDVPVPGLRGFFEHLYSEWGQRFGTFKLVLILDQFEELFTRFVDLDHIAIATASSRKNMPDWRLRKAFFEEIKDLYCHGALLQIKEGVDSANNDQVHSSQLPIRYVISMRDEYIAKLDDIRHFVKDLDEAAYHITYIDKDVARSIIDQPAKMFGYNYSNDCILEILNKLVTEGSMIEPAHIQIVCEKLWQTYGEKLSKQAEASIPEKNLPEIDIDSFMKVGGADGILASYFTEFLDRYSPEEQVEILEILEPLITTTGTRNIVEQSELISAPLHYKHVRKKLLNELQDYRIVRIEGRLGAYFAEITHEFLIPSVLDAIEKHIIRNRYNRYLRGAIRDIYRLIQFDFRSSINSSLHLDEYKTLHKHRANLNWSEKTSEVMFRNMVINGMPKDVIFEWATRYNKLSQPFEVSDLLSTLPKRKKYDLKFDLSELKLLRQEGVKNKLKTDDVEFVLRSILTYANDRDKEEISYWLTGV